MVDSWLCPLGISYQVTQEWDQIGWGTSQIHGGIDLAPTAGGNPPIYAVRSGTVTTVTFDSIGGNYVIIQHDDGYWSYYGHFSSVNVSVGNRVTTDTVVGIMGQTGLATGVHLHFEVWKGAQWQRVNPRSVISFDGKGRTNSPGNPHDGNSNKTEIGEEKMKVVKLLGTPDLYLVKSTGVKKINANEWTGLKRVYGFKDSDVDTINGSELAYITSAVK